MALGSTQALVKMSTRNVSGGKGGRCVRLTTSPSLRAECHENLGAQTSWNPLGHTGPLTGIPLPFYPKQNGARVVPVLQVRMSAMLLFIVGK
jgi:hypothetical protein